MPPFRQWDDVGQFFSGGCGKKGHSGAAAGDPSRRVERPPKLCVGGLPEIFRDNLRRLLTYEGFPAAAIQAILADCGEFAYARTQSKQVLGCMNDMAYQYKWHLWDGKSLDEAISSVNETPYGKIFPMDELRALVNRAIKLPQI